MPRGVRSSAFGGAFRRHRPQRNARLEQTQFLNGLERWFVISEIVAADAQHARAVLGLGRRGFGVAACLAPFGEPLLRGAHRRLGRGLRGGQLGAARLRIGRDARGTCDVGARSCQTGFTVRHFGDRGFVRGARGFDGAIVRFACRRSFGQRRNARIDIGDRFALCLRGGDGGCRLFSGPRTLRRRACEICFVCEPLFQRTSFGEERLDSEPLFERTLLRRAERGCEVGFR